MTLLHIAGKSADLNMMKLLHNRGCDILSCDNVRFDYIFSTGMIIANIKYRMVNLS